MRYKKCKLIICIISTLNFCGFFYILIFFMFFPTLHSCRWIHTFFSTNNITQIRGCVIPASLQTYIYQELMNTEYTELSRDLENKKNRKINNPESRYRIHPEENPFKLIKIVIISVPRILLLNYLQKSWTAKS